MEPDSGISDEAYQDQILPHVSRTFALTIPQLPPALRTRGDERLSALPHRRHHRGRAGAVGRRHLPLSPERFTAVVQGTRGCARLARDVAPRLSDRTLPAERDLVAQHGAGHPGRARLRRAAARRDPTLHRGDVPTACTSSSAPRASRGSPARRDLDDYCYYVAGVVGEMLTELFCAYSPAIVRHDAAL